jgi:nucleotide-binding universal stress UspA family protein
MASGQRRLVVGVDESPGGRRALRYAADRADREGATLTAAHAWALFGVPRPPAEPGIVPPLAEFEASAGKLLSDIVQSELGPRAATVELRVVQDAPARALLALAHDFDELIVGARGAGGFVGLLLGSTTTQLVTHAACPVTVVRGEG